MFSQEKAFGRRVLVLTLTAMLGLSALAAYGQAPTDSGGTPAQPVLPPASNELGKDVAKTTELPAADVPPPSRVPAVKYDNYVIGVGDGLDINVWKEGELSKGVAVRPDGMISLPLVGEIKAAGLTPSQLQDQITTSLQKVMSDPQVTVMVISVNSMSFNIVGNVFKPGYYPLTRPVTILDALALSGGFRDFAKEK
jgi:protein involved in polysaccharide export with SLBB domain